MPLLLLASGIELCAGATIGLLALRSLMATVTMAPAGSEARCATLWTLMCELPKYDKLLAEKGVGVGG